MSNISVEACSMLLVFNVVKIKNSSFLEAKLIAMFETLKALAPVGHWKYLRDQSWSLTFEQKVLGKLNFKGWWGSKQQSNEPWFQSKVGGVERNPVNLSRKPMWGLCKLDGM
jgi:hypothetical protein